VNRAVKQYYVYIMTNASHRLYVGVTSDLERRVRQHQSGEVPGFTSRYHLHRLGYYEVTDDIKGAIDREKQIKAWRREKKVALLESQNPGWRDLSEDW
jgi:putative endonuclease